MLKYVEIENVLAGSGQIMALVGTVFSLWSGSVNAVAFDQKTNGHLYLMIRLVILVFSDFNWLRQMQNTVFDWMYKDLWSGWSY